MKYVWVSVYVPVNVREKMRKFWNNVNNSLMEIGRGSKCVLIRDMNGRVGNNEIGVVGNWGVDEVNANGEYLDTCS